MKKPDLYEMWGICVMKHHNSPMNWQDAANDFAKMVVQECIDKIETYRIPVGNSASGELACEWTYDALKEIRDDIRETFGLSDDRG